MANCVGEGAVSHLLIALVLLVLQLSSVVALGEHVTAPLHRRRPVIEHLQLVDGLVLKAERLKVELLEVRAASLQDLRHQATTNPQ